MSCQIFSRSDITGVVQMTGFITQTHTRYLTIQLQSEAAFLCGLHFYKDNQTI